MSRMQIQSTTVEENFVFGSPPLLNGFTYNSCRSQEGVFKPIHDCCSYNIDCSQCCMVDENLNSEIMSTSPGIKLNGFNQNKYSSYGYSRSYSNFQSVKNGFRNGDMLIDNLNQLSLNNLRTSHVDNGIKILEQAGIKVQKLSNHELMFKKRKDLRVLKSVLSNERFREVVMKFGDGGDEGKEILDSVHRAMKNSNLSCVTCLFCLSESQVYENFPVVDGTLFLTPIQLSHDCMKFVEKPLSSHERYMGYICVNCMEGKPKVLRCANCSTPWNGSFFQIGTLYSYNILSAIPCCDQQVSCKKCEIPIVDITKGEAASLYFSHFSTKTTCPHCRTEDFHFVKSLSSLSGANTESM